MLGSRSATAIGGVLLSVVVSLVLWWYFDTFFFLLVVPFVPFLFRQRGDRSPPRARTCPKCGFRTTDQTHTYCPRDGTPLERETDSP